MEQLSPMERGVFDAWSGKRIERWSSETGRDETDRTQKRRELASSHTFYYKPLYVLIQQGEPLLESVAWRNHMVRARSSRESHSRFSSPHSHPSVALKLINARYQHTTS